LSEAAARLKWSGAELYAIAKRLLDTGDELGANELMLIALSYQSVEDRLVDYAEEVKDGRIVRSDLY
jgi:hypothetical protein